MFTICLFFSFASAICAAKISFWVCPSFFSPCNSNSPAPNAPIPIAKEGNSPTDNPK